MKKLKVAILGFGGRGYVYACFVKNHPEMYAFAAVIDINPNKLAAAVRELGVSEKICFKNYKDFLNSGLPCDMVAVCTQDAQHKEHSEAFLAAGYDLLLEKPMSNRREDCVDIVRLAKKLEKKVVICHVLRYTKFYREIKSIIDSGEIGEVVTITQVENVGYWHQAHSFVRGAWRNKETASPMILAKCCHDLDIIKWMMGERCVGVSSFGSLFHFKKENKTAGSSGRCIDCNVRKDCLYDAVEFYERMPGWAAAFSGDYNNLYEALKESDFGRCVYACDNNVVDHQVVNMLFGKGKTAQLTMSAFSDECYRALKVFGTKGEITGRMEDRKICVKAFKKPERIIDLNALTTDFSAHQGGDNQMMLDVHTYFTTGVMREGITDALSSLESHVMAFAAEESRVEGGILKPVMVEI